MISIRKFSKLVLAALISLTLHSCSDGSDDGGGSAPASNADSSSLIQSFISNASSGSYKTSDNLDLILVFPVEVAVTGTPSIQADIGGNIITANYLAGDGTKELIFRYQIQVGDEDTDGIEILSPIALNGGSLEYQENGTKNCPLEFTSLDTSEVVVDGINPSIQSFSLPEDGTHLNSETLNFSVQFSEIINVDETGGTPSLVLNIDGNISYAEYASGSGSDTLTFTYLVKTSDEDLDGISMASPININGGTIKDAALNDADITFIPPSLSNVIVYGKVITVSLTTPADGSIINTSNDSATFTVEGTCSEAAETVVIQIDGEDAASQFGFTCDGSNFSGTIDTIGISDGAKSFQAQIDDGIIIATSSAHTINKDISIPTITLNTLATINSENVSSYNVGGTCSDNDQNVIVDIGGVIDSTACSSGNFSLSLDVSSIADNSSIAVTANHNDAAGNSALQATGSILKDVVAPTVAITSSPDITKANVAAYSFSGTCDEEAATINVNLDGLLYAPTCSSGTWNVNSENVNSRADNSKLPITANLIDAAGNEAIQASVTVDKDTTGQIVTISSAPNITDSNQSAYVASGTCSDNGQIVSVDIGGLSFSPECGSETWTTGKVDVSSLSNSSKISVTVDHSTADQATKSITKETSVPMISSLTVLNTLVTSVDIDWSLNDPGGFTINDYLINYRVLGSKAWSTFKNSSDSYTTVSDLKASTTYEFRVAVNYDTTKTSEWSEIAQGTTKLDDPIYGTNASMNINGATSGVVTAYQDDTNITINGSALVTLNEGQTHTFKSAQFDVIDADKSIDIVGNMGSEVKELSVKEAALKESSVKDVSVEETSSKEDSKSDQENILWQQTSWAGTQFNFNTSESNPIDVYVYAIEDTTIEIESGSETLYTINISAGNSELIKWSDYGSYLVNSTGNILAFKKTKTTDSK